MLNENNYHVFDTYHGWKEMGYRTDTDIWSNWFNNEVMPQVYNEMGTMTAFNSINAADGENTIILVKSYYPNSDVGKLIEDEQEIYLSLPDYFYNHQDKMFVLITPPPMQKNSMTKKPEHYVTGWYQNTAGGKNIQGTIYLYLIFIVCLHQKIIIIYSLTEKKCV